MKGLDNWITGVNDPNAPFNQIDMEDYYAPVIEVSEWITDDMLNDDEKRFILEECLDSAYTLLLEDNESKGEETYLPKQKQFVLMKSNDEWLSKVAHDLYVKKINDLG